MKSTWRVDRKTEAFVVGAPPQLLVHIVREGSSFAMRPTREEFDAFSVGDEVTVTVEKAKL